MRNFSRTAQDFYVRIRKWRSMMAKGIHEAYPALAVKINRE
jgi:hypothetical protein